MANSYNFITQVRAEQFTGIEPTLLEHPVVIIANNCYIVCSSRNHFIDVEDWFVLWGGEPHRAEVFSNERFQELTKGLGEL